MAGMYACDPLGEPPARRVMEQFRVGRNEYDYGLMIEADAARRLGAEAHKACGGGVRRRLSDYHLEKGLSRVLWVGLAGRPACGDRAARFPCGGRDLQQHRC